MILNGIANGLNKVTGLLDSVKDGVTGLVTAAKKTSDDEARAYLRDTIGVGLAEKQPVPPYFVPTR